MPSTFPCPNPVCTQVFQADAVKGASRLVCPRCGTKFEFRPPTAAARTPTPPAKAPPRPPAKTPAKPPPLPASVAKPVAPTRPSPPPLPAKPVGPPPAPKQGPTPQDGIRHGVGQHHQPPPAVPLATPVAAAPPPPSALAFNSKPDLVLTPRRRRGGLPGWLIAVLLLVGIFGGTAALIWGAIYNGVHWGAPAGPSGLSADEKRGFSEQGNFRITPPDPPWQRDDGLRAALNASLAYSRKKRVRCLALAFKDYQKRLPRDAEMIDDALDRLRAYLSDLEYEILPPVELSGKQAARIGFAGGDPQNVPVEGECVMLAYRGVGYWHFTWGPAPDADERDAVAAEWEALRRDFALGDQREGWTEARAKTITAQGNRLPYKLDYTEAVWEKQELTGYDSHADLVLLGYDPKDKDARRNELSATAQVLVLDKAADLAAAVKEAKDAVLEIEKEKQPGTNEYTFPGAVMDVVTDKAMAEHADADVEVGGLPGHVLRLEVKKSADHRKFVALEVVRMDEGVLAVFCESAWERRDYWDQEFTPLLKQLRPAKAK